MSITGDRIRRISKNLNWFYADAQTRAKLGQFDLHKDAERVFGTILGKVLGVELEDLNRKKYNHPAVDFGNTQAGVAVQVTTTVSDQKIRHTLDTFMKYKLDEQYGHIIVMVIALDVDGLTAPVAPANVIFTKDDIWSIPKLISKIEAMDDAEIAQLDQYLQTQMGNLQNANTSQLEKKQLNLGFSALAPGEFLGRNEELAAIEQRVREHYNPIELYGFGGMGKTELAIEYGRRKMADSDVFFVRFDTSIRNTITGPIAEAFSGYSKETADGIQKPDSQIYMEVMDMLGALGRNDILIIDNVDSEEKEFFELCGPEYAALCRLQLNLIITTRFDRGEQGGIEIGALHKQYLDEMMRRILKDTKIQITQQQLDDLIHAVDCHTLAVELIARTLKMTRPRISPEELLEKLRTGDLSSQRFARVDSHKDRNQQKRRIEEHIQNLFRISSLPSEELSYMANAVLMAEKCGLPYDWFAEAQPDFDQDVMQHLLDRGWIHLDNKKDLLTLHPLVYKVAKQELSPTFESSKGFLSGLWRVFEHNERNGIDSEPIASLFAGITGPMYYRLPEEWINVLCAWYDDKIEKLRKSNAWRKKRLEGYYLFEEGKIQEALGCYQWCAENQIPDGFADKLFVDIANIYIDLKQYDEAFQYLLKAVQYDNPTAYNNFAWMNLYGHSCEQNYAVAIEWFKKAADHPEKPSVFANRHLGRLYLGEHKAAPDYSPVDPQKALSYLLRAKELGAENVEDIIKKAKEMLDT